MTENIEKQSTADTPPEKLDAPALAKNGTDSLAQSFATRAAQARDTLKVFRPTLAKLNSVISKFHAIGHDQIGIELATFDKLRAYNLFRENMGNAETNFCLLSIYDARFLVRVMPDNKIDCYAENLNKPYGAIFNIDSDSFWYAAQGAKPKALFNSYHLSKEEDVTKFIDAIAQTNAVLTAHDELREFDLPAAREKEMMPKATSGGFKLKK